MEKTIVEILIWLVIILPISVLIGLLGCMFKTDKLIETVKIISIIDIVLIVITLSVLLIATLINLR